MTKLHLVDDPPERTIEDVDFQKPTMDDLPLMAAHYAQIFADNLKERGLADDVWQTVTLELKTFLYEDVFQWVLPVWE